MPVLVITFQTTEHSCIRSRDTEILCKTLDNSGLPYGNASVNMANTMSHTGESASLRNFRPASKSQHPLRRLKSSIHNLQERHRDRHRPTGFGFVFADRVDSVSTYPPRQGDRMR